MQILLDGTRATYGQFLRVRDLPTYRIVGSVADFPDEYAQAVCGAIPKPQTSRYVPECKMLFDYQKAIAERAVAKRKYALFADCGLGKSLIEFEFLRHASATAPTKGALLITPAMVVPQMQDEYRRFYGEDLPRVSASELPQWLSSCRGIAVTNWDALRGTLSGKNLAAIAADESSMLKSHYGAWAQTLVDLGRGVAFKLCATGTPAPNDRIEFANHAVFLDQARTVNEFLAKYFVNKGQTQERWILKPHALRPFYRGLSHWSIFLSNPATYGWKDNTSPLPPIKTHIDHIELTDAQRAETQETTGTLFVTGVGGIGERAKLARIAKKADGAKPEWIRRKVSEHADESIIIWCKYNDEQSTLEKLLPEAVSIKGETPIDERVAMLAEFKAGQRKVLISKPKVLGFGLNLQVCTRQIFSTCQDSYEEFYQAVKRSNRIGSTKPLNVHLPVTEIEAPMMENVLRKAARVESDTREQEAMFKEIACA